MPKNHYSSCVKYSLYNNKVNIWDLTQAGLNIVNKILINNKLSHSKKDINQHTNMSWFYVHYMMVVRGKTDCQSTNKGLTERILLNKTSGKNQ